MNLKRPFFSFIFSLSFILLGQFISAQENSTIPSYSFEKFKLPEGHLSNSVQDIVQDSIGFMWFASKNGLHRWDGFQFKTYRHDPTDSTSIGGNYVEDIFLAKDGSLFLSVGWALEKALLDRFDYETETFQHYDYPPEMLSNRDAYLVAAIMEDNEGNIWSGTHYGVYKLNRKTGIFKQYLHNADDLNSLSHNICRTIFKDSKGTLWFGTGLFWDQSPQGGLNRYRPETDDFVNYLHDPADPNSLTSNIITELFEDSRGNLWVGTTIGGLHKMDREKGSFERFLNESLKTYQLSIPIESSKSNTFVQFIHEDQQKKLWIGYYNGGITYYDPDTGLTKVFESDKNDPESLPEKYIWSISQLRDGTLWGSTSGPESTVFKIKKRSFSKYKLPSKNNFVSSFHGSSDNRLWVGTDERELFKLDLKSKAKSFFKPKSIKISTSNINSVILDKTLLSNDQILKMISKIVVDNSGGIWMTKKLLPGLIHFNPGNGNLKIYLHDPEDKNSIGEGSVSDILQDDQGQIWMVTAKGDLNLFDPSQDRFIRYKYSSLSNNEIRSGYNCQLNQSNDGKIWVVGTGIKMKQLPPVIGHFDGSVSKFHSLKIDLTTNDFNTFDREIRNIEEDANGNIWICNPRYLIKVDKSNGLVKMYQTHQFEPEYLKCMILDKQGLLWLIGEKISYFDPLIGISDVKTVAMNTIRNFPGFKQTIFKDTNGLIYIGGDGEFQSFDPEIFSDNRGNTAPKTIISGFELLNDTGEKKNGYNRNIFDSSEIQLKYNQNTFSLRFSVLDFKEPQKNRIQFRLDGYEEKWRNIGLEPIATYIKVPPGKYTFQVKGGTFNSDWGEIKQLGILIAPPIWGTWWAYIIYIAIAIAFADRFYRFQLSKKLAVAENNRLKEVNHLKNSLYTNITHEFRTPLTVILGMADSLKSNVANKQLDQAEESLEMIERNGKNLLRLVNEMLDLSKIESGNMELQLIQADVIPFVKYLSESFHSLAQEKKINLTVYSEVDELVMDFDPGKITSIMSNVLSNAIKFTSNNGKIIVHLKKILKSDKAFFFIKIKDNGLGISKKEIANIFNRFYQVDNTSSRKNEGTGIGLALTKEFTELMKGHITVKSAPGKGSEFVIQLPVSNNATKARNVESQIEPDLNRSENKIETDPKIPQENSELPLALIIEDNPDVAHYLKTCLMGKYQTIHASNGKIGIETAFEKVPDIIICDVMMPVKDGFEACAELKSDERTDHIPIIMLTAKASMKDRLTGLSSGADAYLTKPFVKAELFTRLDQLILLRKRIMQKIENDSFSKFLTVKAEHPETKFLQKIIKIIHEEISNHSFGSSVHISHKMHLSESQVYRKLKAITGKSTAVFIRSVRLQYAKELIQTTNKSISEIAYDVGFNDPSWFSRAFKEEFGFSPSAISK